MPTGECEALSLVDNTTSFAPWTERVVEGSLMLVNSAVAVATNLMYMAVIARYPSLRTKSNLLFLNQSVANLIMAAVVMPITISIVFRGRWELPCSACNKLGFLTTVTVMASGWSLCAMTVKAFARLCWVACYKRIYSQQYFCFHITGIWMLSLVPAGVPFGDSGYTFFPSLYLCSVEASASGFWVYCVGLSLAFFGLALAVCYLAILRRLLQIKPPGTTSSTRMQPPCSWAGRWLLCLPPSAAFDLRSVSTTTKMSPLMSPAHSPDVSLQQVWTPVRELPAQAPAQKRGRKRFPDRRTVLRRLNPAHQRLLRTFVVPQLPNIEEITDSDITNERFTVSRSMPTTSRTSEGVADAACILPLTLSDNRPSPVPARTPTPTPGPGPPVGTSGQSLSRAPPCVATTLDRNDNTPGSGPAGGPSPTQTPTPTPSPVSSPRPTHSTGEQGCDGDWRDDMRGARDLWGRGESREQSEAGGTTGGPSSSSETAAAPQPKASRGSVNYLDPSLTERFKLGGHKSPATSANAGQAAARTAKPFGPRSSSGCDRAENGGADSSSVRVYRENVRLVSTLLLLILVFALSNVPVTALVLVSRYTYVSPVIRTAATINAFANAMYNPFFYGIANSNIRLGYKRLVKDMKKSVCGK